MTDETGKELERIAFKTNIRTAEEIGFVLRELPALLSANAGMREALAFYADPYKAIDAGAAPEGHEHVPDFYTELCFGDVAQSALSALPTGEAVTVGDQPPLVFERAPCSGCGAETEGDALNRCLQNNAHGGDWICEGEFDDDHYSVRPTAESVAASNAWLRHNPRPTLPTPSPSEREEKLEAALKTALNLFHKHSVELDSLSSPTTFAELIDEREGDEVLYGLAALLSDTEGE